MFTRKDYKKTVPSDYVDKLLEFVNSLEEEQKELLISLVLGRDDLLKMEDEAPVSDAELDSLIRECE